VRDHQVFEIELVDVATPLRQPEAIMITIKVIQEGASLRSDYPIHPYGLSIEGQSAHGLVAPATFPKEAVSAECACSRVSRFDLQIEKV
jgi:hypothetical protein